MNSNDIWKCPNCGTVNSGNSCRVCHTDCQRDAAASAASRHLSNKPLLIAVIVTGCVLFLIAVAFITYFFFFRASTVESSESTFVTDTVTPVESDNEEDIYYINKYTDSGIYVRSEPSQSSSKILHIKKGDQTTKLKYLGEEKGSDNWFWYMVETPTGETGYVREDVVALWEGDE